MSATLKDLPDRRNYSLMPRQAGNFEEEKALRQPTTDEVHNG